MKMEVKHKMESENVRVRLVHKHSQVFVLERRVQMSLTLNFFRVKYDCNSYKVN